jgi:hypothetical protein
MAIDKKMTNTQHMRMESFYEDDILPVPISYYYLVTSGKVHSDISIFAETMSLLFFEYAT